MGKQGKAGRGVVRLKKPRRLTAGLSDHEHPAVAPDGAHFAFYAGSYGAFAIYVADRRGRLARCLSAGGNNTQPAWSPDGRKVAWRHQDTVESKWELWECALFEDAAPRRVLAHPDWHYKHPCYSPDGARLAYFSDEGSPGVFHIWQLNLADGAQQQLTFGDKQNHAHPAYSPDGGRIAFHAYSGTDESAPAVTNICELELGSGSVRQLTEGADLYKHPFYLNDTLVTCHHERASDGLRRLELLDLASGRLYPLTSGADNDKHPFPHVDSKGCAWVYWASKKLGPELAGEPKTYDIFRARLAGLGKLRGKPEQDKHEQGKRGQDKRERSKRGPKDNVDRRGVADLADLAQLKQRDKWCRDCPQREVERGRLTSWDGAAALKVKGRDKACADCPARAVLG